MTDEELIGLLVFIILVAAFVSLISWSIIADARAAKKEQRLRDIKSTRGKELREITKAEATELIKSFSRNVKQDLKLLSLGTNYFIYGSSLEGWLTTSAKIPNCSILVAKKFYLKQEIENPGINASSRILIFKNYDTVSKTRCDIIRHVWAVGDLSKEKELLTYIYEREEFKQFYERYEGQLLEIWRLGEDFYRQAEVQKALCDSKEVFVATTYRFGLHRASFQIYEATDGFQVITKIPYTGK